MYFMWDENNTRQIQVSNRRREEKSGKTVKTGEAQTRGRSGDR